MTFEEEAEQFLLHLRHDKPAGPKQSGVSNTRSDDWSPGDDIFDYDPADPDGEFAGISCYWADDGC